MEIKPSDNFSYPNQQTPLLIEFVLLLFLIIILSGLGSGIVQLLGYLMGMDYLAIASKLTMDSPVMEKNFIRWSLGIGQLCTFTFPALLFMVLLAKKNWAKDLQLKQIPTGKTLLLGGLFILLLFPFVQWTYWFNKQIPLPEWAIQQEDLINGTISSLLQINKPYELWLNLFVIGILPALGEELIFRGILQQKLEKMRQQPHLAVWATAIFFSSIHLQFQGFLPRLLLGAALGYLFVWTRNLWVPIFAHFVFNGSQVLMQYFYYTTKRASLNMEDMEQFPISVTILSMIFVFFVGRWLKKTASSEIW